MTDYFALLKQPRRPWLDLDQLTQAFHDDALRVHPDTRAQDGGAFAELNEGYQVLQDPKRRLQHLLTLHGRAPAKTPQSVPPQIGEMFPLVADVTRAADDVAAKSMRASNALARSLIKSELLQMDDRIDSVLARLSALQQQAISDLQAVDADWNERSPTLEQLEPLYILLSYVSRWIADLQEKQLQLSIQN